MVIGLGKRLGRGERKEEIASGDLPPPRPEEQLYVVGDVHGRADLLRKLLDKLDEDLDREKCEQARVVFVGDYVDRGEKSSEVLHMMHWLAWEYPDFVTCLIGNHEKMMLDFLEDPGASGSIWLRNGGLQTLASYGVGGISERATAEERQKASDAMRAAMYDGLEDWLRSCPLVWRSGNVVCVHAAAKPDMPIEEQDTKTLIWGNRDFLSTPRSDGLWIAHGHTTVEQPQLAQSRISVDTGAYFTGRLTAAALSPDGRHRFIST